MMSPRNAENSPRLSMTSVHSSSASEWSDPRIDEERQPSGVSIPDFLQPLFGLDFIPFVGQGDEADDSNQIPTEVRDCSASLQGTLAEDPPPPRYFSSEPLQPKITTLPPLDSSLPKTKKVLRNSGSWRGGFPWIRKTMRARAKSDGEMIQPTTPRKRFLGKHSPSAKPPMASPLTTKVKSPINDLLQELKHHQGELMRVESQSLQVKRQAENLGQQVAEYHAEIDRMRKALETSIPKLHQAEAELTNAKQQLHKLHQSASKSSKAICDLLQRLPESNESARTEISSATSLSTRQQRCSSSERTSEVNSFRSSCSSSGRSFDFDAPILSPVRQRANTDSRLLSHSSSSSFMRVADLPLEENNNNNPSSLAVKQESFGEFFFIDHGVSLVVDQLYQLGYQVVTDESSRFEPMGDTAKLLKNHSPQSQQPSTWPIHPWHTIRNSEDVYLWKGQVPHRGFGHDWPVVKARTWVNAEPLSLVDFLLDSSKVHKYNKMSQGREEVQILQHGVDTAAYESPYGLWGDIRILRTLNKPKLLPKTIEVLSLWYTKELEDCPGSYLIVSRSVWENDSGVHESDDPNRLRSEMLLGVILVRPHMGGSEMTSITHVFATGVPGGLAKRHAPSSAVNMIRGIKAVFQ